MTLNQAAAFLCLLLWATTNAEETKVSCVYLESCLLPCVFEPGDNTVIHWTKQPEDIPVHDYYSNQYQPQHETDIHREQTFLSDDDIRRGNASLQLRQVRISDEGRYKCYVTTTTTDSSTESYVHLRVHAPVLKMSWRVNEERVQCGSENIYPRPVVTWSLSCGPAPHPRTFTQKSWSGLFSVSSSVTLTQHPRTEYSCNISTKHSWRRFTYKSNPQISGSYHWAVPCRALSAGWKILIWRLNHKETILTRTRSELVYTESWRPFVDGLTESNSLVLKDLTQDQLGLFICEIYTDTEDFLITTEVTEVTEEDLNTLLSTTEILKIVLGSAVAILIILIIVIIVLCTCNREVY